MLGKSDLKVLRRTALAVAAGLAVASSSVYAQSNATGTVYGTVSAAGAGSVIVVENLSTGAKRSVTPDSSGRYQFTALTPGNYKVSLMKGDTVVSSQNVEVLIGAGAEATFAVGASGNQLETVQVTGTRRMIDSTTANSVSTFTAKQLAALPVQQDLTSIILLAPDTVKADPRYAGGASIGGGAPSENSYYINGFPATNALSQLGSIELPFGAIQQARVQTGGFGAEFGRSTGGVIDVVTKSGGNKWEGGVFASIEPNSLRSKQHNLSLTDGTLYQKMDDNSKSVYKYGAYVGGPIIQDKLFFFAALDQSRTDRDNINGNADSSTLNYNGWATGKDTNNRWLAKVDWNITDSHHLEVTTFGDTYKTDEKYYSFDYGTLKHGSTVNYSARYQDQANLSPGVGGQASMIKYTGNLSDSFTLTALYGEAKTKHKEIYSGLGTGGLPPGVGFSGSPAAATPAGFTITNTNPLAGVNIGDPTSEDKIKAGRLDLEWAAGYGHTVRAGIDKVKLSSAAAGVAISGGAFWTYRFTSNTTGPLALPGSPVLCNYGTLACQGYYVRKYVFSDTTSAYSNQDSEYIQDNWQVNKKLTLTYGLRNEGFTGENGEHATYLKSKNFISPRLAGAYDMFGDSTFKLVGTLGRYSIQTPTHVAVRGAGVSTYLWTYYAYTGVDPATGVPTGLTAITPTYSPDGENGQPKDANTIAPTNIKPSYQDELRLGFEKALSAKWVGGMTMTYRKLKNTLDDYCGTALQDYADAHGIDSSAWTGAGGCVLMNPGRNNSYLVDYGNTKTYTNVTLTPALVGFPEKPKRTFLALDFSLEHPFADGWYGRVTYTWSRNKGNTEGQTKSDLGQTDVSVTETWDFPALMDKAYGYLPSDRTHQIHAFGYYQATPEIMVGANLTAQSGRPKNCLGNYPDPNQDIYGGTSAFFYCNVGGTQVATPRGSQGRLPWDHSLDLNVMYTPSQFKGLTLRADVFNVLNHQSVLAIDETHEAGGDPAAILPTYGQPLAYSTPRYVKFTVEYKF